ncbi:amino acid adenylation domain-containing protein [Streptomyces sp. NPDC006140]|uniref:non-ribosomal peptide synthetase n=2 Tax=unclassified Streptomyces TaxID=2593676 RepID=UPI0033E64898
MNGDLVRTADTAEGPERLAELLGELRRARVRLRVEGDQLRVSAAKGALTAELREELRAHKEGLLSHLRAEAAAEQPVRPLPRDGRAFPLSPAQEALWLLDQMEGHQPTYVLSGKVRLTGPVRVERLTDCLSHLVRRHESLRTAFRAGADGAPEQTLCPPAPLPLVHEDLSGLTDQERDAALARLAEGVAREPFDLAGGNLLRAVLATTAPQRAYLFLAVHHIAADAASLGVLFDELFTLYAADTSALPPLSVQAVDATEWQRAALSPVTEAEQLAYWKERLDGAPPLLELPTDRPRPVSQSYRGDTVPFVLDPETTARLREMAAGAQVTPYVAVLALWAVLLGRHARTDDVVIGTPVSNRERPEVANLVGFFVGTLPLRIDLSGDPDVTELLRRVQRTFLEGFENRQVPFQRIVAALRPDRSPSHAPVFQNMLTYYETPLGDIRAGELTARREDVHNGTAKFDLTLFVEDQGDRLACSLEYATDLFDRDTAERLAAAFRQLAASAAENPGTEVSRLALLTADQRDHLVHGRNGAHREVDLDRPVHRYLSERAARSPDATAIEHGTESWTYAGLEAESNRLARLLAEEGVGRSTLVGLYARRSIRQIVAMLAILKTGAAFLPLDPDHPADRTAGTLDDAHCPLLLSDAPLDTPDGTRLLRLDELDWSDRDGAELATFTGRDDPIYTIYTSGSTGRPKGIVMRHGALANLLAWQTAAFPFAADDRTLQFSPLHFDICMMETFGTWAAGGTVVLVDAETRRDALQLLPWLVERGITRLFLPYVALQQLAEVAAVREQWPTALREVFSAGEQLHITSELRTFFTRTEAVLHNQYGPSEAHVITSHTLTGAPDQWEPVPPVGRPVDNVRVVLLDRHGEPVPQGVAAEVCVSGPCLALGYLGQDELTAAHFVPDPHRPGERMYRTGDLARYRGDGAIEYLGRIDHQVKVRGFRVEPGEVEAALLSHPGVREAVVAARGQGAEQALVAWVVTAGQDLTPHGLRRHCADRLPEYMVPTRYVTLDALPLTVAGKVERKRLPAPVAEGTGGAEPSTPMEKSVAAVFAEVLGVASVGRDDDFFRLGGHSLAVTRAALRLSEEHGVGLTAQVVFARPTVAGVAESLETLLWAAAGSAARNPDSPGTTAEREEGEL